MPFMEYLNRGSRNLSYFDLKLIGWAGVVFGLWVGKIIPALTSIPNPVLIALFILFLAKPMYVWLRRTGAGGDSSKD